MHYRRWLPGLLLGLSLGGCTTFVARQIERPGHPNRKQLAWFSTQLKQAHFQRDAMRTRDGVRIAYWYDSPHAFGVEVPIVEQRRDRRFTLNFQIDYKGSLGHAAPIPARGSVVLLHPWGLAGSAMAMWGLLLAQSGYVVVLPDLRSQGNSGDAPVGYGPREAGDMVDLVHHLRATDRLPGPLYLLGASYGATVALFAAPRLPEVQGVIAIEPYANAAAVIRRAPASGLFGYRWLAHLITDEEIDAAIARASRKLGVDLDRLGPGDALAETSACTLLLRGSDDVLVSNTDLELLSRRSRLADFVEIPDEGHLSLPLRTDRLLPPLLAWMQSLPAAPKTCPAFSLPPAKPVSAKYASARATAKAKPRR